MDGWRTKIRCYLTPAGNNKIADWYNDLLPQEKADTDTFIRNMRLTRDWRMDDYRPRLRDGEGLGELRWNSCNKKHRLLGFFKGGYWFAVVGCTHKQQVYSPADALETAKKYKRSIERGEVNTVDYDL
jgi:hypothetical protein